MFDDKKYEVATQTVAEQLVAMVLADCDDETREELLEEYAADEASEILRRAKALLERA